MLHWHQILKYMHEYTGKEIEKRAVAELITYFEEQITIVIHQALLEFNLLNADKQNQGLYQKTRIDQECIQRAIQHLTHQDKPNQEQWRDVINAFQDMR